MRASHSPPRSTGEFLLDPLPDRSGCLLLDLLLPGPSGMDLRAALQRQGVVNSLSTRERQIIDRVVAGKLNKEIAHELRISDRAVKADCSDLMTKNGTVSIADLGRQAEQFRHALEGTSGL